jgi:hypothetical protein
MHGDGAGSQCLVVATDGGGWVAAGGGGTAARVGEDEAHRDAIGTWQTVP